MNTCIKILSVITFLSLIGCQSDDDYTNLSLETGEELLGGSTTVFNATEEAFGFSASQLTFEEQ